jgi:hypothetical protein
MSKKRIPCNNSSDGDVCKSKRQDSLRGRSKIGIGLFRRSFIGLAYRVHSKVKTFNENNEIIWLYRCQTCGGFNNDIR